MINDYQGVLHIMIEKIKELIFRDVKNKNETKTVAVTLRLTALVFCLYFLCLSVIYMTIQNKHSALICLGCSIFYALSVYTTYLEQTRFAAIFSQCLMLIWVTLFVYEFGWDCGVQHFLFVLLVLNFTVTFHRIRFKILIAAGTCMYRILLYFYARYYKPVIGLPDNVYWVVQVVNTIFIFAELTIILIVFTQNSQQMEQKLMRYNKKLEYLASVDSLTGLDNRYSMCTYLDSIIKEYNNRKINAISIAIGDIDFFKQVNDKYGHEAGDKVLCHITDIFKEVMYGKGMVGRWGGEEFLFAFYNVNGDQAFEILQEILKRINDLSINYNGQTIRVTMTFGLTEYTKKLPVEDVIQEADAKLYHGKGNGRNQIVY